MNKRKLIIIGAGPAGLTAAIYAARACLNPLVIEGYQNGGQLMLTHEVENFPGFEKGILGPELIHNMRAQAIRLGAQFLSQDVTKIELKEKNGFFEIQVENDYYFAEALIISTGSKSRMLGLESEQTYFGRGVSTCATCDGAFFKNEEIFVVGGGDSALEEALFLTKHAKKVTLIHRKNNFRASKIAQKKVMEHPKISIIYDSIIEEILGENQSMNSLKLKNLKTNETSVVYGTGLFIAIGHLPNTELFKNSIECDQEGYIITKNKTSETSIKGVFACGDVQDRHYRQAITAAGSGCSAALDAERYLEFKNA